CEVSIDPLFASEEFDPRNLLCKWSNNLCGLLLMMDLPIIPQRLLLHLQSKFRGSNSSDANSGSIETSQARFLLWVLYFHMAKRITISEAHLSGRYLG